MAINATSLLRFLERKLGVSHNIIELSELDLIEIVKQDSLPIFSNYFPYIQRILVNSANDKVENRDCVYYLKTDLEILGVAKVIVSDIEMGLPARTNFVGNPVDDYCQNLLESLCVNPVTFRWEPPNKVELFPKTQFLTQILVEMKTVHPENFSTIPLNLRKEFFDLALFDVQESLYQVRHRFQSLNTTFGEIQLFLDELEQARDKKEDLLEKWRTNYLKSASHKKIFVY